MRESFRISTLQERRKFYAKEFSISKLKRWFKDNKIPLPQLCAIDPGGDTKVILNKKWLNDIYYFKFSELARKIKKYIPEDIYYDRNFYSNIEKTLNKGSFDSYLRQELVFDIDCDNIKCDHSRKEKLCDKCLKKAYLSTLKLEKKLRTMGFGKMALTYSGRGFHVHVLDEKAYSFSRADRKEITKELLNFPIDEWVSEGNISLIRLPYSLNAVVSRKVIPFSRDFKEEKTLPNFIKKGN